MKKVQNQLTFDQRRKGVAGYTLQILIHIFLGKRLRLKLAMLLLTFTLAGTSFGQETQAEEQQKSLQVYGFAMVDMGYNLDQIDPRWFDALRINRLPKYKD